MIKCLVCWFGCRLTKLWPTEVSVQHSIPDAGDKLSRHKVLPTNSQEWRWLPGEVWDGHHLDLHSGRTLLLRRMNLRKAFNCGKADQAAGRLPSLKHHIMLSSSSKDIDTLITVHWSENGFCLNNPGKITLCESKKKKKKKNIPFLFWCPSDFHLSVIEKHSKSKDLTE